jgi:hypothetical protein
MQIKNFWHFFQVSIHQSLIHAHQVLKHPEPVVIEIKISNCSTCKGCPSSTEKTLFCTEKKRLLSIKALWRLLDEQNKKPVAMVCSRVRPHFRFGSEIWNWSKNFVLLGSEKKPDLTWFTLMRNTKNLKPKRR